EPSQGTLWKKCRCSYCQMKGQEVVKTNDENEEEIMGVKEVKGVRVSSSKIKVPDVTLRRLT
ncbi:5894_t:CDS:2, partial [Scutellospora calospora]